MNTIGIILVVLGLVFLFQNAGLIPADWSTWWPAILIIIGLGIIGGRRDRRIRRVLDWRMGERGRRGDEGEMRDTSEQPAYGHEPDEEEERRNRDKGMGY